MRKDKFIFSILLLLGVNLLFAQNETALDSIHHSYKKPKTDTARNLIHTNWSKTSYNANPDSSLASTNKVLQQSKRINYTKEISRSERAITLKLKDYMTIYNQLQDQNEKKNYFLNELKAKEAKLHYEQQQKDLELKRDAIRRRWLRIGVALGIIFLISQLVLISKNLKKQKELNKRLKEMNSTKDKFFSIISHDLKSPFNSILGFSELLNDNIEEFKQDELKKITTSIYESAKSAYDLLEQLLAWTAFQSEKIEYKPESISIKVIVAENIKMVNSSAEQKQIQITDNTPDSQLVFVDQNMLNTVVRNLLTNAIKFTYRGGRIDISSTIKNHMLFLSIKDNGQGISAIKLKELFNEGALNSTKGTNNESGTGLGLILCKEFIEKNKGKLKVESEEGKGSNFIISLPFPS